MHAMPNCPIRNKKQIPGNMGTETWGVATFRRQKEEKHRTGCQLGGQDASEWVKMVRKWKSHWTWPLKVTSEKRLQLWICKSISVKHIFECVLAQAQREHLENYAPCVMAVISGRWDYRFLNLYYIFYFQKCPWPPLKFISMVGGDWNYSCVKDHCTRVVAETLFIVAKNDVNGYQKRDGWKLSTLVLGTLPKHTKGWTWPSADGWGISMRHE